MKFLPNFFILLLQIPNLFSEAYYYGKGVSLQVPQGYSIQASSPKTGEALHQLLMQFYPKSLLEKLNKQAAILILPTNELKNGVLVMEEMPGAASFSKQLAQLYTDHIKKRLKEQGWTDLEVNLPQNPVIVNGVSCVQLQAKGIYQNQTKYYLCSLIPVLDSFLELKLVLNEENFKTGYKVFMQVLQYMSGAHAPENDRTLSVLVWQFFFLALLIFLFRVSRKMN